MGDGRYCPRCGSSNDDTLDAPLPTRYGQPYGNSIGPYLYPEKSVNQLAFALLAIFLGWLGVHRFYAGRPLSGVGFLLLLFLGIGLIISIPLSFLEGIISLTRKTDMNGNIPVYKGKYFV